MIRYFGKEKGTILEVGRWEEATWINISPPVDGGELERFAAQLGIETDFLSDPLDIEERARYEKYDEVRSVIFHSPVVNESEKDSDPIFITVPIGIILCKNILITVCAVDSPVIERFHEKIKNSRYRHYYLDNEKTFILHLFQQNVLLFLEYLKKLNMRRSLIEQELFNSSRSQELRSLLRIEKSLVYFVNSLSANELLKIKMKRTDFLGIKEDEYCNDLFEDIIVDNNQAREVAQLYTNILNGTMEAYASIISNNLNKFINRLTTITVILMIPTLVSSFFGMNVPLPFSMGDSNASFYLIFIVTLSLSAGIGWFLRRKDFW